MKNKQKRVKKNKGDEQIYKCYLAIFKVLDKYTNEIQLAAVARVNAHLIEHLAEEFPVPVEYCK